MPNPTQSQFEASSLQRQLAYIFEALINGITLNAGDLEIGAVELKNSDSDSRAKIAALTSITTADIGIAVADPIGNQIAALTSSELASFHSGQIAEMQYLSSRDFATQTTLAAVLAKIIAAPATEAKQDTGNTSLATIAAKDFATQTTLAAVLAKIVASPALEATQVSGNASLTTIAAKDFATQTTLAAVLAKIIAAPSTEAKQDSLISANHTDLLAILNKQKSGGQRTPTITANTSASGTISAGCYNLTLIAGDTFAGTVLGYTLAAGASLTLPVQTGDTLGSVAWTRTAGTLFSVEIR